MGLLTRISLGNIDNLTEAEVVQIGNGTLRASYIYNNHLVLKTPEERRVIRNLAKLSSRDDFLEGADNLLSENQLYLADVEYSADNPHKIFSTHELSGTFYREKIE